MVADHVRSFCSTGSILDIGTGPGWLLLELRRLSPELELVGVDISRAMVTTAQDNMKKRGTAPLQFD
jgi:ubiquinone/menaquinone biosynthesis C-methylase UbiE